MYKTQCLNESYATVVHCPVQYSTVLYCTVLYSTVTILGKVTWGRGLGESLLDLVIYELHEGIILL